MEKANRRRKCCVGGCGVLEVAGMHRFPRELKVLKKWVIALHFQHIDDISWLPKSHYKVCNRHFLSSQFTNHLKTRLLKSAVPMLHLLKHIYKEHSFSFVSNRTFIFGESSNRPPLLSGTKKKTKKTFRIIFSNLFFWCLQC